MIPGSSQGCPVWRSMSSIGSSSGDPFEGAGSEAAKPWNKQGKGMGKQQSKATAAVVTTISSNIGVCPAGQGCIGRQSDQTQACCLLVQGCKSQTKIILTGYASLGVAAGESYQQQKSTPQNKIKVKSDFWHHKRNTFNLLCARSPETTMIIPNI